MKKLRLYLIIVALVLISFPGVANAKTLNCSTSGKGLQDVHDIDANSEKRSNWMGEHKYGKKYYPTTPLTCRDVRAYIRAWIRSEGTRPWTAYDYRWQDYPTDNDSLSDFEQFVSKKVSKISPNLDNRYKGKKCFRPGTKPTRLGLVWHTWANRCTISHPFQKYNVRKYGRMYVDCEVMVYPSRITELGIQCFMPNPDNHFWFTWSDGKQSNWVCHPDNPNKDCYSLD